jgi:hypothetical protein
VIWISTIAMAASRRFFMIENFSLWDRSSEQRPYDAMDFIGPAIDADIGVAFPGIPTANTPAVIFSEGDTV